MDRRPRRPQRVTTRHIARILDPDRITGIEQHPARELERLLGAGDDYDLIGAAANTPRIAQVGRHGLAQRAPARRIAIAQQSGIGFADMAGRQPRPDPEREFLERRDARSERGRRFRPGSGAGRAQEMSAGREIIANTARGRGIHSRRRFLPGDAREIHR